MGITQNHCAHTHTLPNLCYCPVASQAQEIKTYTVGFWFPYIFDMVVGKMRNFCIWLFIALKTWGTCVDFMAGESSRGTARCSVTGRNFDQVT